ncbi:MAG: FecR family protein [Ginsengibacter sp.]
MESQENFKAIFQKYLENKCSPKEVDWLLAFLKNNEQQENVQQILEQQLSGNVNERDISDPVVKKQLEIRLKKILEEITLEEEVSVIPMNVPHIRRFNPTRIAAAVIVIFLLGSGVYYLFNRNATKEVVKTNAPVREDIAAPASAHAIITLANGERIVLDSVKNGTLAMQGNVNIKKLSDGQIGYTGTSDKIEYNTLSNPKGSKIINLTLSDGSKVWLNSESSLRFPAAFAGHERKVEITGEAYFEVARNATMPFKVLKGETVITVLGTHFNVNAYEDESALKVTLLEGSVQVKHQTSIVKIKPGQQAEVPNHADPLNKPILVETVDGDKVMAWKNGLFEFDNTDLATIMRQVSRWYDVEVVYDGKSRDARFGGGLSKGLPLSNVLKLMEANGVRFKLEGKVLRVIP